MLVSYYLPCLNLLFPSNKINPIIIKIIGQNFPKSKSGKKLLARNRKPKIINKLPPISPDFTSPLMLIVCLAVFSTSSTKSLKVELFLHLFLGLAQLVSLALQSIVLYNQGLQ